MHHATTSPDSQTLHQYETGEEFALCGEDAFYDVDPEAVTFGLLAGLFHPCRHCDIAATRQDDGGSDGHLPEHSGNVAVRAAAAAIASAGHEPARFGARRGTPAASATGFLVIPAGEGAIAVCRLFRGDFTQGRGTRPFLDAYHRVLMAAGWYVRIEEETGRVIARRPDAEAGLATVTPESPRQHPGA